MSDSERIEAAARAAHDFERSRATDPDDYLSWDECGLFVKQWWRELVTVALEAAT